MVTCVAAYRASVDFLSDEQAYRCALARVPAFRAKKAQRYIFAKDRRLSIGAWLLLERALMREGIDANAAEPQLNAQGKPFLPDGPHFNLSHSAASVMCAISRDCPVGCDVEEIRPFDESVARYCMQSAEVEEMLALDDDARDRAFIRRWTLKESYMKARGLGLSLPPDSFAITLADGTPPAVIDDASCALAEFTIYDGCCYAACALDARAVFAPLQTVDLSEGM